MKNNNTVLKGMFLNHMEDGVRRDSNRAKILNLKFKIKNTE